MLQILPIVQQLGTYPTAIAERDANVRLSRDMADKIVTLLLITAKDWME